MSGPGTSAIATWLGVLSTLTLAMVGGLVTTVIQWATMRSDIRYLRRDVAALITREADEHSEIRSEVLADRNAANDRFNRLERLHMNGGPIRPGPQSNPGSSP